MKNIYLKILFILLTIYSLIGFIILPYLIQSNFSNIIKEKLNINAYLGRVYINPFTFNVGLYNLLIKDDKFKTLLYFKSLKTDFEISKLLFGEIELDYIDIDSLKTEISLYKNNDFNFSYIVKQLNKQPQEKISQNDKSTDSNILFTLNSLFLQDTRIEYTDETKSKIFSVKSKPFNFTIKNFSTKPNSIAKIDTTIEIIDTLNLDLKSNLSLAPIQANGNITLKQFQLEKVYAYLEDDVKFQFQGLIQNISSSFKINLNNNKVEANIQDFNLNIPRFNYSDNRFQININEINSSIKTININKEDTINFNINTINLLTQKIIFTDELKNENYPLDFKNLHINIDKFSSNKEEQNKISLSLTTPNSGNININAKTIQSPLIIEAVAKISSLDVVPYKEYIKDFINIDIKNTLVDVDSEIQFNNNMQKVQANINISKIDLFHDITKKRLLTMNTFDISGLQYINNNLTIENITFDKFKTSFKIDTNKMTNIDGLIITKNDKTVDSKEESTSQFNYYIKSLQISNGRVEFSDHSLPLKFDTNIHSLNTTIHNLSSKNDEAHIKLNGTIEKYGLAQIEAKTILSNFKNKTDVTINFKNLDVKSFSPYSGKFIGQKIADGKLWLDLNYQISNAQLLSTNNIKLKNLTLGEDINSTEAISLPIGLAIALLEDNDGLIDLDIPIKGDMDEPEFELGGVIWKTLGNIITNIVTAPFKFLGSLLGIDSDELGTIEFNFAEAKILPPQQEKLNKLAQVLQKKKNLIIILQPTVNKINDIKVLKEQKFSLLINSDDKNKMIKTLYEKRFGENKLDDLSSKYKEDELIDILAQGIKATIHISNEELHLLAKQRVINIKTYLLSHKLGLDRIKIKNDVFENKDNDTKELSLKLKLNIKD